MRRVMLSSVLGRGIVRVGVGCLLQVGPVDGGQVARRLIDVQVVAYHATVTQKNERQNSDQIAEETKGTGTRQGQPSCAWCR